MLQLLPDPPPPQEYCFFWAHRWWTWSEPWWACMQKSEWSGWAQAIGVVLTILAGFVYIVLQNRMAASATREVARLRRRTMLHAVQVALRDAHAVAVVARGTLDDHEPEWRPITEEARRAHETLDSIHLLELGETEVMHRVGMVKMDLRGLIQASEMFQTLPLTPERYANSVPVFEKRVGFYELVLEGVAQRISECSTPAERNRDEAMEAVAVDLFVWRTEGQ